MSNEQEDLNEEILKTFASATNAVLFLRGWCILLTVGVIANFILLVVR